MELLFNKGCRKNTCQNSQNEALKITEDVNNNTIIVIYYYNYKKSIKEDTEFINILKI